jgi:hypothetical protein
MSKSRKKKTPNGYLHCRIWNKPNLLSNRGRMPQDHQAEWRVARISSA